MKDYVNVRLTKEEYSLINQIRDKMAEKGLPLDVLENKSLEQYLNEVKRDSLAKGALVGIGLLSLLYLISKKE